MSGTGTALHLLLLMVGLLFICVLNLAERVKRLERRHDDTAREKAGE